MKFIFRSQPWHYYPRDTFPTPSPSPWGCVLAKCRILSLFYFMHFIVFACSLFPLLDYELYEGKGYNCVVYCFYFHSLTHCVTL